MGGTEAKEPHPSRSAPRAPSSPSLSLPLDPSILAERLDEAILRRDLEAIRDLISHDADPTCLTGLPHHRSTPLHTACNPTVGSAILEALLAAKSVDINATDKFGRTPLHTLLRGANHYLIRDARTRLVPQLVTCVRLLVRAGADVNARTSRGETPFHFGAELGVAVAEQLIAFGAKSDATTNDGCTAVSFAVRGGELGVLRLLLTRETAVVVNVRSGDDLSVRPLDLVDRAMWWPELLDTLIHCGVDLSRLTLRAKDGRTQLFSQHIMPAIMCRLIRLGVPLNARAQHGQTALFSHVMSGEHLRVLLDAGARVNARDSDRNTVLHLAATSYADKAKHAPLLELLLSAGANPRVENEEGRTPKELARQKGHLWIVERLSTAKIP